VSLRFVKAHGHGNDFLLIEASLAPADAAAWARRLCERHTGIGADGVLLYTPRGAARLGMRLVNADGSDAEISGNGLRCLAAFGVRAGLVPPDHVVETAAGARAVRVSVLGDARYRVVAELGMPQLLGPLDEDLKVEGRRVRVTAISMGNPHCALLGDALPDADELRTLGAALERHPRFPARTNVEFVRVASPREIEVRFWERGVGHTRSSGTGSASAAAAAVLHGRVERRVTVRCEGGNLEVEWPEGGPLRQTGEVQLVAAGEWLAG
jgi:diaminopimelate epimerase